MSERGYWFAVNLRSDTTSADFVRALRPWGWLAAPENTTSATRQYARKATRRGRAFIADNGNYARIGTVTAPYVTAAKQLRDQLTSLENQLGRSAIRADLPPTLRAAYDGLARTAAAAARAVMPDTETIIAGQQSLGATQLIGYEDIQAAVLLSLDVEPHLLGWERRRWRGINRTVAQRAADAATAHPDLAELLYPVASALDWRSAFDAGREFAAAGLRRASMGFGAYMADNHSIDFVRVRSRTIRFNTRLPQRYLRTAIVARGFVEGYTTTAGHPPEALHFLGLGAPIMIAIVALAAQGVDQVSFDAMSPIRDAVEGTLYTARPAYLKIRARAIAAQIAHGERSDWACPCPFCRQFATNHPTDLAAALAWGNTHTDEPVADDLRPGGGLYAALPLLAEPASGTLRQHVTQTRVGHNHWVLNQICRDLRTHTRNNRLQAAVQALVEAYASRTNSPSFARAVRFGYELAAS